MNRTDKQEKSKKGKKPAIVKIKNPPAKRARTEANKARRVAKDKKLKEQKALEVNVVDRGDTRFVRRRDMTAFRVARKAKVLAEGRAMTENQRKLLQLKKQLFIH